MAELTGKAISELPAATTINDTDLLAISQNGASKKITPPVLLSEVKDEISGLSGSLATYVRPNLLDNWYFIRGKKQTDIVSFPVNQRRQNSYIGNQYGIDRWIGANTNVTLGLAYSNYIVLKSSTSGSQNLLIQYFENKEWFAGKTVTISAIVNNTLIKSTIEVPADSSTWGSTIGAGSASVGGCSIYLRYLNSKLCFVFYGTNDYTANTNILLRAAKIEIGSTQTLAHQKNGTWVLNEIPDYAAELAKCQRYYVRFDLAAWTNFGFVVGSTATVGSAVINLPQVMHKNPTVKFSGDVLAKSTISTTSANGRLAQSMVSANITTTDLELYGIFPLRSGANGAIVEMDADL